MNPSTAFERTRRASRMLSVACLLLVILLPAALVVHWVVADSRELAMRGANLAPGLLQGELSGWQRVWGCVFSLIPLLLLMRGVWEARSCFRQFAAGAVFTAQAVRCLRRFSGWAFASAFATVIAGSAVSVVLTWHHAPGTRQLAISFGSDQLLMLFFAAMVWVMAGIIGQGQQLAEENAAFV